MLNALICLLTARRGPKSENPVVGERSNRVVVGCKGDRTDRPVAAHKAAEQLAAPCVPYAHRPVCSTRHNPPSIV